MRLELTRVGLPVQFANHYTTSVPTWRANIEELFNRSKEMMRKDVRTAPKEVFSV